MARGDVVVDNVSVADTAYMTIQPGSGVEWLIQNITWPTSTSVQVSTYDGTNECIFHTDTTLGGLINCSFALTNGNYMRVKNVTGSGSAVMHYDGFVVSA
jgi:hypothetical protein